MSSDHCPPGWWPAESLLQGVCEEGSSAVSGCYPFALQVYLDTRVSRRSLDMRAGMMAGTLCQVGGLPLSVSQLWGLLPNPDPGFSWRHLLLSHCLCQPSPAKWVTPGGCYKTQHKTARSKKPNSLEATLRPDNRGPCGRGLSCGRGLFLHSRLAQAPARKTWRRLHRVSAHLHLQATAA